jgi:hypothetical protein
MIFAPYWRLCVYAFVYKFQLPIIILSSKKEDKSKTLTHSSPFYNLTKHFSCLFTFASRTIAKIRHQIFRNTDFQFRSQAKKYSLFKKATIFSNCTNKTLPRNFSLLVPSTFTPQLTTFHWFSAKIPVVDTRTHRMVCFGKYKFPVFRRFTTIMYNDEASSVYRRTVAQTLPRQVCIIFPSQCVSHGEAKTHTTKALLSQENI